MEIGSVAIGDARDICVATKWRLWRHLVAAFLLKVDVLAVQEAQLPSGRNIAIPGYGDPQLLPYTNPKSNPEDEREDHFSLDMFPSLPNVIAVGDINGHHPVWDVNCSEPDAVGNRVNDWLELHHWVTLNSGAATCVGYGNRTRQTAPDVAMCHRDMAGRCTWAVGEDLGSDHLPQLIHTSIGGARPKRIRKSRWAFHKADWTGFAADCDAALADLRPDSLSVEGLSERLVAAILSASTAHIPRGARADPKPWALDPDLACVRILQRYVRSYT
ncbi:hypothetical protein FJT64_018136 [Amphibalanus amphitrite]|uniref:Endonuclease/exonuclease/phosphatase domain-containing protein n=1 Tax=Amphibalanus amphitrite TaxID=1232801 RepID=A0A6A4X0D9_AMPAM|nr:hypothetical protein FJT64_018136 [Amphibalanus amphitrite]